MASPQPKSPKPAHTIKKKEESFLDYLGTLGRRKKIKEVEDLAAEEANAIDYEGRILDQELLPEDCLLEEGEERAVITRESYESPQFEELINILIEWINDELAKHRIIVKNVEDDLYDGQILHKLLEQLTNSRIDVVEMTQNEEGQREKLKVVLERASQALGVPTWGHGLKWSVNAIHSKNVVAIVHLLVALARHFRAPVRARLPENVVVNVVSVTKRNGQLVPAKLQEQLTRTYDEYGMKVERDAFDQLFDHAPDKLTIVKKSLLTFVNKHLSKIYVDVKDLDREFHDGVKLAFLMGLLEGYFIPLYYLILKPDNFEQKVNNVTFAFGLMKDAGLPKPKARPEDIVNYDLKSTLRVLYNIFMQYKNAQ
ncbi:beta-parvin-like [Tropilaelaps mercedesae]|uniref:Beta-parvin-like n=1 Tax=Tropilaelaps mercedesae TaxID=418985 RepID=A0A1V9Y1P0_9ACAR|nr:beta-parvin-like [Tropilaelaps mercedesae]